MAAHDEPMAYPGGTNPQPFPGGTNPPGASEADVHLERLLAGNVEEPFFRSLFRNVKEFIHPPKLPPLQVTSQPVPVKDIWGFYGGQEKKAGVTSLLIHGTVIALLILLGMNKKVQETARQAVTLIAPDIAPYIPNPPKKNTMAGGGGGGDRSPLPAPKGKLPKLADKQFVPPMVVVRNEHPKLVME